MRLPAYSPRPAPMISSSRPAAARCGWRSFANGSRELATMTRERGVTRLHIEEALISGQEGQAVEIFLCRPHGAPPWPGVVIVGLGRARIGLYGPGGRPCGPYAIGRA